MHWFLSNHPPQSNLGFAQYLMFKNSGSKTIPFQSLVIVCKSLMVAPFEVANKSPCTWYFNTQWDPQGKRHGRVVKSVEVGLGWLVLGSNQKKKKCTGVFIEGGSLGGCVEGRVESPFCRARGKTLSLIEGSVTSICNSCRFFTGRVQGTVIKKKKKGKDPTNDTSTYK